MPDTPDGLKAALQDRYAIQRELDRGSMATVYLAEDLKHHRPVALKLLRPELAAVLGPERFLREIELAARLTHPHILPLHDSGNAHGFLYYVMPYVEGKSLRDRLTREKQLPRRAVLFLRHATVGRTQRRVAALPRVRRNHDCSCPWSIGRNALPCRIVLSGSRGPACPKDACPSQTPRGGGTVPPRGHARTSEKEAS